MVKLKKCYLFWENQLVGWLIVIICWRDINVSIGSIEIVKKIIVDDE